jgi:DNA polymerase-3 subunit epsilon
MSGWHTGPMAPFDLETTGVDTESARIVTACAAMVHGSGEFQPQVRQWLVNPGIEIPYEATRIHGITTEHAEENGQDAAEAVAEIRDHLYYLWGLGYPIVGHNIVYDLTVLDRELARHHGDELEVAGPVIDTLVLDGHVSYRKGKRTLTACAEFYGVRLDEAHNAVDDALASARIAWMIASRHETVAVRALTELHEQQVGWHAARQESFRAYLQRQGKDTSDVCGGWPLRPRPAAVAA